MSAILKTDPDEEMARIILAGELPSQSTPPSGCKFHPRCIHARVTCRSVKHEMKEVEGQRVGINVIKEKNECLVL